MHVQLAPHLNIHTPSACLFLLGTLMPWITATACSLAHGPHTHPRWPMTMQHAALPMCTPTPSSWACNHCILSNTCPPTFIPHPTLSYPPPLPLHPACMQGHERAPCVLFMAPHACHSLCSLAHTCPLPCLCACPLLHPGFSTLAQCPCPTLALVHPCHCHPPCAILHAHSHPHATSCVHGAIHIFILLR